MTNFIWPSDLERAENDDLNRVCEYAEELSEELEAAPIMSRIALRKIEQMDGKPVGLLVQNKAGARAAVDENGRVLWLDSWGVGPVAISTNGEVGDEYEDARLIVTAVNYHERLVEALTRVDRDMQKQGKVRQETMCNIDGLIYELDNLEK